ncbi:hypothetical protein [Streptomyces marianii]|uniref:Uncharacterized protein n=1 Tax=Streptomyces marianii TaxID=1817406 RepID=A0A5R9DYX6_9ACTN|nr:hypothetical protein [Streptomyces marianii]TLQ42397.1 hypothetical protein FEF34_03470 [Streptomyces marianii]
MRASRAVAVAITACAAMGATSPVVAATATGGGNGPANVRLSPSEVHQGSTLTILVDGCHRGGTVSSNAFPAANLSADRGGFYGPSGKRAGTRST